jgi:hypothetical protein
VATKKTPNVPRATKRNTEAWKLSDSFTTVITEAGVVGLGVGFVEHREVHSDDSGRY